MSWNYNMDEAPKGRYEKREKVGRNGEVVKFDVFIPDTIIVASKCEKVIVSRYLETGRWNFFTKGVPPIAWQPYPTHPYKDEKTR